MYGANLSFRQLENYLDLMMESSLLEKTVNVDGATYETTHKGQNFLQQYHEIKALLTTEDNDYEDRIKEVPLQSL
jgi:predicted transcriptional regulator